MAIVYVSRDARGRISGVFANAQHGYATEAIDDQTLEVRAFLADTSIYRRAGTARAVHNSAAGSPATRSRPWSSGPRPTPRLNAGR